VKCTRVPETHVISIVSWPHPPFTASLIPTARLRLLQPSKGSCRSVRRSAFWSSVPMDGHLPQVLYSNPAAGGASVIQRASSHHVVGTLNDSNTAVSRPSTPLRLLPEASRNAPPACVPTPIRPDADRCPVFPILQGVPAEQILHSIQSSPAVFRDAKYQVWFGCLSEWTPLFRQ